MPMMLCVPRSVSPIDVRQAAAKGPPATPPRSKLFTRNKDTSAASPPTNNLKPPQPPSAAGPSNISASSFSAGSSTACSEATTTVTEDGGIAQSPGPTTPVSMSKRTGSKWLASLRSPSSKQRPSAKDVVAVAELATSAQALETGIISAAPGTTTSTPRPTSSQGRTRTLNKEAAAAASASSPTKQQQAGNVAAGGDSSETSNVSSVGSAGGKTLTSFLGSLTKRPKEPVEVAPPAPKPTSRPTPSPLPLQPRDMAPVDLQSESEEDEDESDDEDDDFADVSLDVYPNSQASAQPPSIFYPSSSSSNHHHHHHHHRRPPSTGFQIPEPLTNPGGGPRKPPQPLRSHINLLQITTSSLQPSPSPHPLITTPRSAGNGGSGGSNGGMNAGTSSSANGAPLFPRSCNPARQLPLARSVLATLHKTRVICRLESPGSLTAAEELSIMPFATRMPGSHRGANGGDRSSNNPANAMYPSSSYRNSNYRSSLMRNLALEDGDLIREVDVNAGAAAGPGGVQGNNHYPTFSKGLKRWLARPPFEQRAVVWTPASSSYGADLGIVRSAVHRPALMGPAPLEYSEGVEALAGVVRPKRIAWQVGGGKSRASVTQVVAPLHHPKPTSGSVRFGGVQDGPTLVIPPPPLLSSSPSSTTSVDTTPNTPGSTSSSSPNLASLVPPAFLKRLRQSAIAYVDPNISDEDDVPLGVVVIKKHSDDRDKPVSSPSKDDPQERARRLREKEQEKEKRKLKDAERKKAFKEQVLASRIRSQAHRVGGRYGPASLSQDWIEVDASNPPSPPANGTTGGRGSSSAPARGPSPNPKRSATVPAPIPTNSSSTSIRSQSSAKSRSASARPPSIVDSERSYQSARTQQTQSTQHQHQHQHRRQHNSGSMGMMPMMTAAPIMVYNPNANNLALPPPPFPPQFFAPPPPPMPVSATSTIKSSKSSRRDSGYGEFGLPQQPQQQQQHQKSSSSNGQHFWTMPSRRSSKSDADKTSYSNAGDSSRRSSVVSQHGLLPPRPRFASNTSNDSSSDNGGNNSSSSRRSANSASYSTSRRSSMLIPPMLTGRNIN